MTEDALENVTTDDVWAAAPDGMLLVDQAGIVRAANSKADLLFGFDPGGLLGRNVDSLMPQEQAATHAALRDQFNTKHRRRAMGIAQHLTALRADATTFTVSIALSPLGSDGLTIAAVRDMSDHLAYENRLVDSTRRRLLAEDHERIARDLHDTVIQELFALGMTLQATLGQITDDEIVRRIGGSVATLDDIIHSIRAFIFDIGKTSANTAVSLRAELVGIAATLSPSLGFEPAVLFRGPIDTAVPDHVHDHLYAVVREGLANVARHADATAAAVTVTIAEQHVTVRITDDGRGMPSSGGRRSGLANLLERALSVGGTCEVSADPEGGTLLRWVAPLTGA